MNSSNSNKQDPNRNKKKSKSEEESTKSQNLLEPTSEKSGESRNNIENNNYETSNYQELQDKLLTTENDLKQTKGELEKLAERNTRLVSDNRNLTDENQNLVVEKTELEKTIKELTRKTSNLEEKLNSIKVDERAERKDPKTSKAKFEIHLYEREGQLNGKIAYPLVKNDMESFNGIDQGTIISFIKKHLDYIKRPEEISKDLKAKQKKTELNPAIYGLELYQAGALMPRQSITGDQAFQTQFIIDFQNVDIEINVPIKYNASIYAKELSKGSMLNVGQMNNVVLPEKKSTINIPCKGLGNGIYRLYASVDFTLPDENALLFKSHFQSGLINVA